MRYAVRKLKTMYIYSRNACAKRYSRAESICRTPGKKCEDGDLKVSAFWPQLAVGKAPAAFWGQRTTLSAKLGSLSIVCASPRAYNEGISQLYWRLLSILY